MQLIAVQLIAPDSAIHCQIQLWMANSFRERLRGVIGRESLLDRAPIWLKPCRSVHTMGLSAPIDLAFLDKHGRVLCLCEQVLSWRWCAFPAAYSVIELRAGSLTDWPLTVGWQCRPGEQNSNPEGG